MLNLNQVNLVPLEEISLPSELNGSHGKNRSHKPSLLPAQHDMQAIELWLSRLDKESHTHRAYRREAERILLWAIVDRGKAFSSLHTIDMSDYQRFLQDPQPVTQWIGPPKRKGHTEWKPFTGTLSTRNTRYAENVLNALFTWFVDQCYLQINPMKGMPPLSRTKSLSKNNLYSSIAANNLPRRLINKSCTTYSWTGTKQQLDINRSFSKSEWKLIKDYLADKKLSSEQKAQIHYLPDKPDSKCSLCNRASAARHAKVAIGDIGKIERNCNTQYWLKVIGKGNKFREVPVPSALIQVINETYSMLTGEDWETVPKTFPLIPRIRGQSVLPLTPLVIHKALKAFFAEVACFLRESDSEASEKLARASAHWLRHTHGTHADDMNIPAIPLKRDKIRARLPYFSIMS